MTRRGFTLIEVLLGLALLALVVTLVQGVYAGVTRSRDRAREQTEGAHAAALVLQRLADELGSASQTPDAGDEEGEGLVLEVDASKDSRLDFTTTLPALAQEEGEGAGPAFGETSARIGYSVETADDGTRQLVRTDSRLTESDEEEPDAVLERVTRFRVTLSADGKTWEDASSGEVPAEGEAAPRLAAIELGWEVGPLGKPQERLLRTAVALYGAAP